MATLAITNIDTLLDHAIHDEGAKVNFCALKQFLSSLVGVLEVGGVEVNATTLLAFGDNSRYSKKMKCLILRGKMGNRVYKLFFSK